jgi:hypothetical protein
LVALLIVAWASGARAQSATAVWLDLVGRVATAKAPHSWLGGDTGRLAFGDGADRWQGDVLGEAQLGLDWTATERFAVHLHGRGRAQQDDGGDAGGIVEAWAQATALPRDGADRFRLRAGALFLPTSRENVGPLWTSPYTLTLSAINSWVGEEVRPVGLLAEYEVGLAAAQGVRLGACVFGGNDSSGALLAWRGWATGERLSTLGETLPLPALPSFEPGRPFAGQDREGTTPFGRDLDGRPGWAAYARWRAGDQGLLQITHLDSRGDRGLHRGEYAWDTRFDQLGGELHPALGWTLAGEHLRGRTVMGLPRPAADASFRASYLLLSWERGTVRTTARYDDFGTSDRDHLAAGELSDEDGRAWTAALMWQVRPSLGIGIEYLDVDVGRPALAGPGVRRDGGRMVTLGFRHRIGSAG